MKDSKMWEEYREDSTVKSLSFKILQWEMARDNEGSSPGDKHVARLRITVLKRELDEYVSNKYPEIYKNLKG